MIELAAHSLNEVRYYLMVTPCSSCGKGPWVSQQELPDASTQATIEIRCKSCSAGEQLSFVCQFPAEGGPYGSDTINPSSQPSKIIDLGQWLSLFYLLVESAASQSPGPSARRGGYQAALCLAEALKFYDDNELPPASAFFCPASAAAYHEHPENFTRQRLRDMQAKLPAMPTMARQVRRDQAGPRRRWWRFWR